MKKISKVVFLSLILSVASRAWAVDLGTITRPWASSSTTALDFIAKVINFFLVLTGTFAIIALIYAGFMYIIAGEDTAKVEMAKKTINWAITGIIVTALAYLIVWEVVRQYR